MTSTTPCIISSRFRCSGEHVRSRALSHVFSLFSTRDRVTHFHLELLQCKKECVSWPGERSIALTYLAQRGEKRDRVTHFHLELLQCKKGVRELAGRTQHRTHLSCPERKKASKLSSSGKITI